MFKKAIVFGISGGDCPGLNSALAAVVHEAHTNGLEAYALINGLEALCSDPSVFPERIIKLTPQLAERFVAWGSILSGSSRTNLRDKDKKVEQQKQANAVANAKKFKGLVLVGGDDHAKQAGILAEFIKDDNVPVAILPKSVDYDCHTLMLGPLTATESYLHLFYSSALSAKVHIRCNVYEFMGRSRSWLTVLGSYGYPEVFAPEALPDGYSIKHLYPFDSLSEGLKNSIRQTQGSIFRLIAERPVAFKDVLVRALEIMIGEERPAEGVETVNGKGEAIKPQARCYVNIAVSEGFTFLDALSEEHRHKKDTLFYRMLELSPKFKADFEAETEVDEHGNPKFSGIGQYIQFGLQQIPQLTEHDSDIDALYKKLTAAAEKIGKSAIFKQVVKEGMSVTILNGPRYDLPAFEVRGLLPNKREQLLGEKFGKKAVELILENRTGLEVCMDRYAVVEETDADARPVADIAITESLMDVHSDEELKAAGVLL